MGLAKTAETGRANFIDQMAETYGGMYPVHHDVLIERVKKFKCLKIIFGPSVFYLFDHSVNFWPAGFLLIRLSGFGLMVQFVSICIRISDESFLMAQNELKTQVT